MAGIKMKEQCVITLIEVEQLLDMLSSLLPVKYGSVYNHIQKFFVDKLSSDTVNNEEDKQVSP